MEGELDLLLSVAGGLGRWQYVDDLQRVYVKDDDCLGEKSFGKGLWHVSAGCQLLWQECSCCCPAAGSIQGTLCNSSTLQQFKHLSAVMILDLQCIRGN